MKNGRDFWSVCCGLRLPGNKAREILERFSKNSEECSGANPGRKLEKFWELSFCNFSDLTWSFSIETCLGANVLSGLVPSTVFKKNLWAFLGPCVRGRGRPWYGTSAQPESHFTCSSPRGAPRVVPSTSLLNYFWAFLVALGRGEGAPLVRYLC